MALSFIFGGDTGKTPEDLKRERAIAAALAEYRTPQNVGEGIGAIMRGLASGVMNYRANKAETAGRQSATDAFTPLLEALRRPSTKDTSSL